MPLTPLAVTDEMIASVRTGSGQAVDETEARRLLGVAAALVARSLDPTGDRTDRPPADVETEAVITTAAFMADRPGGPIAREKSADVEIDYATGARTMNPVRGSGALGMLAPWREHGTGKISAA